MDAAGSACLLAMTMAMGVSAGLGFERGNHAAHRRAEAKQHVFEHRVFGDAEETIAHLGSDMAIAQMICQPRQFARMVRLDL